MLKLIQALNASAGVLLAALVIVSVVAVAGAVYVLIENPWKHH